MKRRVKSKNPMRRMASRGFRGYPVATVAFYGLGFGCVERYSAVPKRKSPILGVYFETIPRNPNIL